CAVAIDLGFYLASKVTSLPAESGRWAAIATLAAAVPAWLWARREARMLARVKRVAVPLSGLGPELSGLRIVQVSDVHIGDTLGARYLERLVDRVNQLDPDVVAITGDLVDGPLAALKGEVEPLTRLRARHGVYFVPGNHEYYSAVEEWLAELGRLGLDILHNEHRVLQVGASALVVAGVTDYSGGSFDPAHTSDPERALRGAPGG